MARTLRSNPDIREVQADIEAVIIQGMATWIWESAFSTWLEGEISEGRVDARADVRHMANLSEDDPGASATHAAALGLRAIVAKAEKLEGAYPLIALFELAYQIHTGDELEYDRYQPSESSRQRNEVEKLALDFGTYLAAEIEGASVAWSDSHVVKRKHGKTMLAYEGPRARAEVHFFVNYHAAGTLAEAGLSWSGDYSARLSGDATFSWPYQANGSEIPTIEDGPAVVIVEAYTTEESDDLGSSITEVHELDMTSPIKRVISALDFMADEPDVFDVTSKLAIDPIDGSTWFTKDAFEAEDGGMVRYSFVLRNVASAEADMVGMIVNDTRTERNATGNNGPVRYDMGDLIFLTDNASWTRNVYVLWFGQTSYERYVIFANSLDDALDEGIDYMADIRSDIFVDEIVEEEHRRLTAERIAALNDPRITDFRHLDDRDQEAIYQAAEADTTTGGNNGRRINRNDWGIVAENPSLAELVEIAYRRTR